MKKNSFRTALALFIAASLSGCSFIPGTGGNDDDSSAPSKAESSADTSDASEKSENTAAQSSVTDESSAESSEEENILNEVYKAYAEIVTKLESEHGKAHKSLESGISGYAVGLSLVKLMDFNRDGIEELLCAYSDSSDAEFTNRQEVYSYIDGKAVSVYSGKVNYEGGVGPFVEYLDCSDKIYLFTDGNHGYLNYGTWNEFDGKEFKEVFSYKTSPEPDSNGVVPYTIDGKLVTDDEYNSKLDEFRSKGTENHITFYREEEMDRLFSETQNVIDVLKGFLADNSDNTEDTNDSDDTGTSLEQAKAVYKSYIDSGEWRSYEAFGENIENDTTLLDPDFAVFDFNGDGVYEMLMFSKGTDTGPRMQSRSVFCTMENKQVKVLLSGAESAGTIGGNSIHLRYDENADTFYISDSYYSGGWGGQASGSACYTMKDDGSLEQILKIDHSAEFNGDEVFLLNDKNTTEEELDKVSDSLHSIFDLSIVDKLYNEKSDKSNIERLKEYDIIK